MTNEQHVKDFTKARVTYFPKAERTRYERQHPFYKIINVRLCSGRGCMNMSREWNGQ
jgi:hypothetical protein